MVFCQNMKVFRNFIGLTPAEHGAIITIGNFDGVHLGHRALMSRLRQEARRLSGPSVVVTFDPHPVQVLYPEKQLRRLFVRQDLIQQLEALAIDGLVVQDFSRDFSQLSAEQFIRKFIVEPLRPRKVIVGYDFSFGANREGNQEKLSMLAKQFHFEFEVLSPIAFDGEVVSSSLIRQALAFGNIEKANQLLGRHFYLDGIVEAGDGRGRQIGIPTANLKLSSETCPKLGVYATKLLLQGKAYPSVTNVGRVPTFHTDWQSGPRIETHVFDQNFNLYGKNVQIEFCHFIRDERQFSGVEELVAQIRRDIDLAKKYHMLGSP